MGAGGGVFPDKGAEIGFCSLYATCEGKPMQIISTSIYVVSKNYMASNVPIVNQVAWKAMVPQSAVLIAIGAICYFCGATNPVFPAAAIYFLLGYVLRNVIAKDQKKGLGLVKKKDYKNAIPAFEASYKFFSDNLWIDKYRYVTLLNASSISYREMALCNVAFCYGQIGEGKKATAYYKWVLDLDPENGIAQTALNALESAHK